MRRGERSGNRDMLGGEGRNDLSGYIGIRSRGITVKGKRQSSRIAE